MISTRGGGGGNGAQMPTVGPLTETRAGVTVQAETPMAAASANATAAILVFM